MSNNATLRAFMCAFFFAFVSCNLWSMDPKNPVSVLPYLPCVEPDACECATDALKEESSCISLDIQNNAGDTPLHLAVMSDEPEEKDRQKLLANREIQLFFVRDLLQAGANPNLKNNKGKTPLHIALETGDKKIVCELLGYGASLIQTDELGNTPLHTACYIARTECDTSLIRLMLHPFGGAVIDIKNRAGKTIRDILEEKKLLDAPTVQALRKLTLARRLYTATINKNIRAVEQALRDGAVAEYTDDQQCVALHHAARLGDSAIARKLLKAGACIDAVNGRGQTAIHIAAQKGKEKVMQVLLDAAVEHAKKDTSFDLQCFVNSADAQAYTALHSAVEHTAIGAVQALLKAGAIQTISGKGGALPLHIAALAGNTPIIRELLAAAGSSDTVNNRAYKGMTPLAAALYYNHKEAALALLTHGADPLLADEKNFTTLNCAVINKDAPMAQLLINTVAQRHGQAAVQEFVGACDTAIEATALHSAASMESFSCASVLIQNGADATAKNKAQVTPLHIICRTGDRDHAFVALLLAHKADPNAMSAIAVPKNEPNGTPLHWAAQYGQAATVRLLLAHGADYCSKNAEGKTALEIALQRGHVHVAQVLHEAFTEDFQKLHDQLSE